MTMTDQEVNEKFWNSVKERALQLPYCSRCGKVFFYPRAICPACWSEVTEWRQLGGRGTVWAHSTVRFPLLRGEWEKRVPYIVALVDLPEGVRLLSNIVDCPPEEVRIGMAVELTYQERDGQVLYLFRPAKN